MIWSFLNEGSVAARGEIVTSKSRGKNGRASRVFSDDAYQVSTASWSSFGLKLDGKMCELKTRLEDVLRVDDFRPRIATYYSVLN